MPRMPGQNSGYKIFLSAAAMKELKRLDPQLQRRIRDAIRKLEVFPPQADIGKVKSRKGVFRLRVGDWRVFFRYNMSQREVEVIAIRPRETAYD